MERYVVRVWLPDRPGALGQVASRIGAVGGDVIGIEILERGAGRAIDDLVVSLPDPGLRDLLIGEVSEVDGVDVEHIHLLPAGEVHDPQVVVLQAAVRLVEQRHDPPLVLAGLCHEVVRAFEGDWAAVVRSDPGEVCASAGDVPEGGWLAAFLLGSRHLGSAGQGPDDVLWSDLPGTGTTLATGRPGRPFRERERRQLGALVRVAGAALQGRSVRGPAA